MAVSRDTASGSSSAVRPRSWWRRGPGLALLLLATVLAGGTSGFILIEGWDPWESFYMTVTTVTTVGYREIHELSPPGQVFNAALIVIGVSTVLYTFSLLMALVVEGTLHDRWSQRRRLRMQTELTQHFIVCGYGRIGRILTEEFRRQQVPFLVVDPDPERVHAAIEAGALAVVGDATHEDLLRRAGIDRARGLITTAGTDADWRP